VLSDLAATAPNCCNAIINLTAAHSNGDNIVVGDVSLPMLRQQASEDGTYASLADYVSPTADYIGMFSVSISTDIEKLKSQYDDYNALILQTLCDRLAEAASEYVHSLVRKKYWGYAPDENLSLRDMYSSKYVGIRPAVGYPSLPDQQLIFTLDKMLNLAEIGVTLTENGAMLPTSSVCGLYFANPASAYFAIGKIDDEQLRDYAARRNVEIDAVKKYLYKNLQ
jgi:5-methyltetrahydrofolate--homocysteine methyltransferase